MSKELRIILALFGGLAVLLVLGIAGLILALPHLAKNLVAQDPKAQAQIAAKIATFDIPRGYHISSAADLGITQTVTIVPDRGGAHIFEIQLTGEKLPPDTANAQRGEDISLGLASSLIKCDFKPEADDVVVIRGKAVHLLVRTCRGGTYAMRVESGTIEGKQPFTRLLAIGNLVTFDAGALHALLRSIR